MKTAAAYIRVSTEDQTEYSPASQLEKICEYAKRNDYIIPDEYIYVDEGISGRHTQKRTGFNSMISTAKQKPKPFDAILLWKFSRFARNREDSIVYKSMLRKQCGIDVISVSENIGDNKMSLLTEAMIEAMDEYYSVNLSEEVRRGMKEKAKRGEAVTVPSFGYCIRNGRYYPDDNAHIVRSIFADFLSGKSIRTIASEINELGIKTRRGNNFESRTVKYILQNPVYIGKIRWTLNENNTMIIEGIHEPIISDKIWNDVQNKLKALPSEKYMRQTDIKEPFMLRGLCRCSSCGATLTRSSYRSSLQCYAYAHGKCSISHSISIKKLNYMLISAIESAGIKGEFKSEPNKKSVYPDNISFLISKENKKAERIIDAFENGLYTAEEFNERRKKVIENIKILKKKQSLNVIPDNTQKNVQKKIHRLLPALLSPFVNESDKNILLRAVIKRIVFYRSTESIDIFFYG